jgi:hypothetical protein
MFLSRCRPRSAYCRGSLFLTCSYTLLAIRCQPAIKRHRRVWVIAQTAAGAATGPLPPALRERIATFDEYELRVSRARTLLEEAGIDALLLTQEKDAVALVRQVRQEKGERRGAA